MCHQKTFSKANITSYRKQAKRRQYNQKRKIESRKQQNVASCFTFILFAVLSVCNQTGQGCNQCSHTADIDAQQKLFVVIRKLREQNGRRHITDNLAG